MVDIEAADGGTLTPTLVFNKFAITSSDDGLCGQLTYEVEYETTMEDFVDVNYEDETNTVPESISLSLDSSTPLNSYTVFLCVTSFDMVYLHVISFEVVIRDCRRISHTYGDGWVSSSLYTSNLLAYEQDLLAEPN